MKVFEVYYECKKLRFCLWLAFIASFAVGCSSAPVPQGERFSAQGSVKRTKDETVDKKIVETEEYMLTKDAMKHRERMAKIEAGVKKAEFEAKAQAERDRLLAENPCAGGWFMSPSFCYGGRNGTFDGGARFYRENGGRWQ